MNIKIFDIVELKNKNKAIVVENIDNRFRIKEFETNSSIIKNSIIDKNEIIDVLYSQGVK